jgi:hypothetical protein
VRLAPRVEQRYGGVELDRLPAQLAQLPYRIVVAAGLVVAAAGARGDLVGADDEAAALR